MNIRYSELCFFLTAILFLGQRGQCLRVQEQQYCCNQQLIAALNNGNTKQALALIHAGADPNTRSSPSSFDKQQESPTALMLACNGSTFDFLDKKPHPVNLKLIQAMLTHGADLRLRENARFTVLDGAISQNRKRVVELLLAQGADTNDRDPITGRTPLMQAAYRNYRDIVRLLLAHGANVNAQDDDGETALHYALNVNYVKELGLYYRVVVKIDKDILQQVLAHGADPNLRSKEAVTPLMLAQKMERSDLVALLRHSGK